MARPIKMTESLCREILQEFAAALRGNRYPDGKVSYTRILAQANRKATLSFTEQAYLKMLMLVNGTDKEVGWHGLVHRAEDETKDEYIVTDLLVYPQEVTGATVTTDQSKYETWLMGHEDEVFNRIRLQGHSHVNMSCVPSPTDTSLYDRIFSQLEEDMFYVFLIWNKRNERMVRIYDMAKNMFFDTDDVTVQVLDGPYGIREFLSNAETMVKTAAPSYSYYSGPYNGAYSKPYGSNPPGLWQPPSAPQASVHVTTSLLSTAPVSQVPASPPPAAVQTTKKKKRKKKKSPPSYPVQDPYDEEEDDTELPIM